ncbi:MAG: glycoside hydrolase [Cyclobacteriaceae bacterium]|nr:glycoside hydrolase [Cyclobacteriaceae bacterium]
MRFAHTVYPGKFNQLACPKKRWNNLLQPVWPHHLSRSCPPRNLQEGASQTERVPHETYFLDVYQANGIFECYAPDHRLTREQFCQEVIKNHQIMEDNYNQYLGGEWGAEYVNAHVAYVHGMMTFQKKPGWGSGIEKKGTIYYTGDWRSNPRPTQMVGTRVANDKYLKYSINEYTRVPLYEMIVPRCGGYFMALGRRQSPHP